MRFVMHSGSSVTVLVQAILTSLNKVFSVTKGTAVSEEKARHGDVSHQELHTVASLSRTFLFSAQGPNTLKGVRNTGLINSNKRQLMFVPEMDRGVKSGIKRPQ